ncbi:hypothetical protein AB0A77_31265 [Streptomyces varsoviensis]|uniref:hypothetical protein n=1 Tax=Streptomyces varsoviensis TaxID=67373 RepID=UPI00340D3F4D
MSTQVAPPSDQTAAPIQEWDATRTDYPRGALVHGLFREQAERMPDNVARSPEGAEESATPSFGAGSIMRRV